KLGPCAAVLAPAPDPAVLWNREPPPQNFDHLDETVTIGQSALTAGRSQKQELDKASSGFRAMPGHEEGRFVHSLNRHCFVISALYSLARSQGRSARDSFSGSPRMTFKSALTASVSALTIFSLSAPAFAQADLDAL